jgi:hypothetical protein
MNADERGLKATPNPKKTTQFGNKTVAQCYHADIKKVVIGVHRRSSAVPF